MSFINSQTKTLHLKIVYFGPAMSGKSTTIRAIHQKLGGRKQGMATLSREQDRTLFFDFLPLTLGDYKDYKVRLHLYSVPGPLLYDANRRLVLKGIDGIIFVVDSQLGRLEENIVCLTDLQENLLEQEVLLEEVPMVFQFNKRDLTKTALPVEALQRALNVNGQPAFETVATKGQGTLEALQAIAKAVLQDLKHQE